MNEQAQLDPTLSIMAKFMGMKGGTRNTSAQRAARRKNAKKAGRMKLLKLRTAKAA
jgi:hypothetical protein